MLSGEVLAGKMLIDYQGEGRNRLELPVMQFLLRDPQSTKENGEFQISRELEGYPPLSSETQKDSFYRGETTFSLAYFHDMVNLSTSLSYVVAPKVSRENYFHPYRVLLAV